MEPRSAGEGNVVAVTGGGASASYTVFVNTVDSYDDCWDPFFHLLATYWPDCPQPVVLNTGRKRYEHDRVDVRSAMGSADVPGDVELPWGERFLRGLAGVDTPFVLYVVEDAFLEAPADGARIAELVALMDAEGLDCIRLVEPDGAGPWLPSPHDGVWEVAPDAEYLAVLQAGLWRTDVLRSLVVPRENPWQFETRGGRRIRAQGRRVHCVDRDRHWVDPSTRLLPYDPITGIQMGRWREDVVVPLFAAHGIDIDLSVRGSFVGGEPRRGVQALVDRVRGKLRTLR